MTAVDDVLNDISQIQERDAAKGAKPDKPPEPEFAKALREQLRTMAAEPLTTKSARQIGMFANASAKLMQIVGKGPLPNRRKRAYGGGWMGMGGSGLDDMDDEGGMSVVPMPIGNPAETFGSTVIRQAMEMWKSMEEAKKRSPVALIRAIGEAKKAGLDDIAQELTIQLRKSTGAGEAPAEILRVDSKPDGSGKPQVTEAVVKADGSGGFSGTEGVVHVGGGIYVPEPPQITEAMVPAAVAAVGDVVDQLRDGLDDAAAMETAEAEALVAELASPPAPEDMLGAGDQFPGSDY